MLRMTVAAVVTLLLGAGQGSAYEFWIDPESFLCEAGDTLSADIRIGEEFDGVALALAPERIARFEVRSSQGELQVDDTVGARPALRAEGLPEGLAVIVHETTPRILTWSQAGRFLSFVRDKAWPRSRSSHEPFTHSMRPTPTGSFGRRPALPMINVDTDMIIPKQFLKTIKRPGSGGTCSTRCATTRTATRSRTSC
jgi:hypothetical protein